MTQDYIKSLVNTLMEAKKTYYEGNPIMPDDAFDNLENQLKELDPDNKYFSIVGFNVKGGNKIKHEYPMRSLDDAKCIYSKDETDRIRSVERWINKLNIPNVVLAIGPKIDGLSCTLKYKKDKLNYAATRGSGQVGQDITYIKDYMSDVPKQINTGLDEVEIRGELYLPKNTEFDTEGKPLRNSATGLINRKTDRHEIKHVRFVAYQVIGMDFEKEQNRIEWLNEKGFHTIELNLVVGLKGVDQFYQHYLDVLRDSWKYETDGIVLTVDDITLHEGLNSGYVIDHHNQFNLAVKPPSEGKETTLLDIEWQVSRQGNLIPVGIVEPINVEGATIQRVTLNNFENVENLNLFCADTVFIQRSNDVIPYFKEVISYHEVEKIGIPTICPECGHTVFREGVHLNCNNPNCDEQKIQKIIYWVKQNSMDGISSETVRMLYDCGYVLNIKDLYRMKFSTLHILDGMGDKKAENLRKQIEKTKGMSIQDLLVGLGISLVGKKALKKLGINTIKDFWEFNDNSYVIGKNIIEYKEMYTKEIEELINILEIKDKEETSISMPKICFTGKGPYGRKELTSKLEEMGYEVCNSITKDLDTLICEDANGSSSKLQKARKLGVPIKPYSDFF